DEEEDDEEILPQTPKRSKTVGSGGPSPTVEKRATKSVTPSKRRADKIIPSYALLFRSLPPTPLFRIPNSAICWRFDVTM
ncbi:hypothetical protein C0992_002325, partial [Termitomyces sp. T32_za158]